MIDSEIIFMCLLIPVAYVLAYIAGKCNLLFVICKMFEEKLEKYQEDSDDGWISLLPKQGKCNGNAAVIDDFFGAFLKINLPYKKELKYKINFCPMCGRKLREGVTE